MKNDVLKDATLVFDLDGTLVDTAPDLIGSLNHALATIGHPRVPHDHIRPFISFGARRMIVEGLAANKTNLGETEIDELFSVFLEHYGANVALESRPYPNLVQALDALQGAGNVLGVCTNKREDLSLSLLSALQLRNRFRSIVGRDTLDVCKPHPRHLTETIARAGGNPARSVMIGDSSTDVKTARAAGIPVVAVTFGYTEIPPHDLGADALIDDHAQLPGVLATLLNA